MVEKDYPDYIVPETQSKDLIKDPVYRFLDQGGNWSKAHAMTFAIGIAFRFVLLGLFGWPAFLGSLTAAIFVLQVPLLLNLVCHIPKLGYKNFTTKDDSVNVWWVGLLAMGEGWHNNHHAFPGSARTGLRLHELDMSWLTLRLMKALGLVSWMNEAKPEQLLIQSPAKAQVQTSVKV
jgi:stearoyl-CoA desaturase (delta-9 desaturase)